MLCSNIDNWDVTLILDSCGVILDVPLAQSRSPTPGLRVGTAAEQPFNLLNSPV